MVRIVYKSISSIPFSEPELRHLVMRAGKRNAERQITGMLVHADGLFLQALEGEEDVVDALYRRIAADPRHSDVQTLSRTTIGTRGFGEWSLGLASASRQQLIDFADRIASWTGPDDNADIIAALRSL